MANHELAPEFNEVTNRVIGAAMEVHTQIGPGYLESTYEAAMGVELGLRRIPHDRQAPARCVYKGVRVGVGRVDLVVAGKLVVELKAVAGVLPIHRAQALAYLNALSMPLALLINFNVPHLRDGIVRIIRS